MILVERYLCSFLLDGLFLINLRLDYFSESFGHFSKGMVPTEIMGNKPIGECVPIIALPTIPIAVGGSFYLPKEFLAAFGTSSVFNECHGRKW